MKPSVTISRKIARAKKQRGPCALCGGDSSVVSPKDGNPHNTDAGNLENYCKSCMILRANHKPERLRILREVREQIVKLIRRFTLTGHELDAIFRHARRFGGLVRGAKVARPRLPKIMTQEALQAFYAAVDKGGNLKHQIMLRLALYTGVRVSELAHIKLAEVNVGEGKIYIAHGKGDKDRYVLIPDHFKMTLKAYIDLCQRDGEQEYLFESSHKRAYSTRHIHTMVSDYAEAAGIPHVHPHMLRHQALTHLTSQGLTDAQIQLVSGHSSKKSLEVYQHIELRHVSVDYQKAMKGLEIG